jgi:hypothetical protein
VHDFQINNYLNGTFFAEEFFQEGKGSTFRAIFFAK